MGTISIQILRENCVKRQNAYIRADERGHHNYHIIYRRRVSHEVAFGLFADIEPPYIQSKDAGSITTIEL